MPFPHAGSSHHSSQATTPAVHVTCPICTKDVLEADINAHLDANCATLPSHSQPHHHGVHDGLSKLSHTVKKVVTAGWGPVDFGHPEHDEFLKATARAVEAPVQPMTVTNNYVLISPVLPAASFSQVPHHGAA